MMTVMRTIIEIPGGQLEGLDRLCVREGISRAEAVRRAVALIVGQEPAGEHEAFGLWRARRGREADGLAYQQKLRREWAAPTARRRRP
jgi:hypothetical protein